MQSRQSHRDRRQFRGCQGHGGVGGGVMVKGYRVPLRDEKIVLKLDDGDGCTPL